ncbi:hypothetical protein [Streptomyces sp. NPDC046939]|uniref:hypothetical protein n=1 Tax=Streptomyces sp. NPDC046939 TaxID=3155376 RepID=UPI0033E6AB69
MTPSPPAPPFVLPPDPADRQTADGWRQWRLHRHDFVPAPRLTRSEFTELSRREQALYELHREATHSNFPLQETPMSRAVAELMRARLRRGALKQNPTTRRGLIINGGGCQGKTETACEVAAAFEDSWLALHHQLHPGAIPGTRDLHLPVAYVQTPVTAKPKSTCKAVLDFYGVDHKRMDLPALIRAVRRHVHAHGTRVILLDDITRLKLHRLDDQDVFDLIKGFMDMSATLILIGVDVPASGLLRDAVRDPRTGDWVLPAPPAGTPASEGAETQHQRRFTQVHLGPFGYTSAAEVTAFTEHLMGVEDHLRLFDAAPGMLTCGDMPAYLHERTGGVVGLLECLIEDGAEAAIDSGEEQLTVELLDQIAISVEGLPNRDAAAGEIPLLPPRHPAPTVRPPVRNTVLDDRTSAVTLPG